MKNVSRIVGRDGVERLYFRKSGHAAVRLASPWGTPELAAEVAALRETLTATARPAPGTLRAALRAYELSSPEFKRLAESTKYEYRLILKELEEDFGQLAIDTFQPGYLLKLRNAWAERGHQVANHRLIVLRNALLPAIIEGKAFKAGDPFAAIPSVRRPADRAEPHPLWPDQVTVAVIRAAVAQQRYGLARAVAIVRYVGSRPGDLVRLTTAARQDGRVRYVTGKRKVPVDLPEDPELTRWLAEIPARQPPAPWRLKRGGAAIVSLHLVFGMRSASYTANGLAAELAKLIAALHKAGKVDRADYDLYGLRHTRGVELALAGVTDAQGAAMMGHGSPHSFATYRRQADRIRLSTQGQELLNGWRERQQNAALAHNFAHALHTPPQNKKGPA